MSLVYHPRRLEIQQYLSNDLNYDREKSSKWVAPALRDLYNRSESMPEPHLRPN